jgi:DNA-binding FrmR family transcriptional regulator
MGAVAAKASGLGQIRDDISKLKNQVKSIEGVVDAIKKQGAFLTEGVNNAKQAKEKIEGQIGGITGKLDSVKQLSDGLGGKIGGVQNLFSKVSGGGLF